MAKEDFFSFDEALDQLRLKEEELKRLVSEGEIRAFREGDTMRLRRQDVENLRNELQGGEVIDLGEISEELVFEDDTEIDETGMATEEISDMDTLLAEDVEDIGEIDLEEDTSDRRPARAMTTRRTGAAAAAVGAAAAGAAEEEEGMGLRVAMIATSVVMLLALPVCISASKGEVSGPARSIANMVGGLFGFEVPE